MKEIIRAHVKSNIKSLGKNGSHYCFSCTYKGTEYQSSTIRPDTATWLLTNKIYFHEVTNRPKVDIYDLSSMD